MTTESTITSKGRTTIPKAIRDCLFMKAGDRITFTLMSDRTIVMRVKNKNILRLAGMLWKKGRRAIPIQQMSR